MGYVISVSRRTDIPAFYSEWFIRRLKEGFVYVQHPYSRRWLKVSLTPDDIDAIVFWSKDYSPLLSMLEEIERYSRNLFFHFTITGNRELEPHTPEWVEASKDFIYIARRYSPDRIIWRYDPICITDRLSFEYYLDNFRRCIEMLKGYANMCYISFANPYRKVMLNLKRYKGQSLLELSNEKKKEYALQLAIIAEKYGIRMYACCNDYLVSEEIMKGSCIDGNYLSRIFNTAISAQKAPSRKECACTKSIDIGAYNTCPHGCFYCYANAERAKVALSFKKHNPQWNSLCKDVKFDLSDNDSQGSLFER
jgi:hypothetical protein